MIKFSKDPQGNWGMTLDGRLMWVIGPLDDVLVAVTEPYTVSGFVPYAEDVIRKIREDCPRDGSELDDFLGNEEYIRSVACMFASDLFDEYGAASEPVSLDLSFILRDDGRFSMQVSNPETGDAKSIESALATDHSDFDRELGNEVYSWIDLMAYKRGVAVPTAAACEFGDGKAHLDLRDMLLDIADEFGGLPDRVIDAAVQHICGDELSFAIIERIVMDALDKARMEA